MEKKFLTRSRLQIFDDSAFQPLLMRKIQGLEGVYTVERA
jgi:hypothetical protein